MRSKAAPPARTTVLIVIGKLQFICIRAGPAVPVHYSGAGTANGSARHNRDCRQPNRETAAEERLLASFAALVVDELELRTIGQSDYLTGAKTRRAFMADLEAACHAPHARRGVMLMLDLDHFKQVNDRYGHPAGDDVLRGVAAACRSAPRRSDVIGRLGGEEFAILLRGMAMTDEMQCAERIRPSVADLRILPDPHGAITASTGVARVIGRDPHATLASADAALYCAKKFGRNRCLAMTEIADLRPVHH